MQVNFQITYDQELKLYNFYVEDLDTKPPTFLDHYHLESLEEVKEEMLEQLKKHKVL